MKPKKSDALEAMVDRHTNFHHLEAWERTEVIALLRRYHAKVRRVVTAKRVDGFATAQRIERFPITWQRGYQQACTDILAALDRLKKGSR